MLKHTSTYTILLLRSKAETGAALLKSESENEREREERSLPPSLSLFRPTFEFQSGFKCSEKKSDVFCSNFFCVKKIFKKTFQKRNTNHK